MRAAPAGLVLAALILSGVAAAQSAEVIAPSDVPDFLPPAVRQNLEIQHRDVSFRLDGLVAFSESRDSKCSAIRASDTALLADCRASLAQLDAAIAAYDKQRQAYEAAITAAVGVFWATPGIVRGLNGRAYVASGNGLVGGTSWVMNYNVPPGASRETAERQREELKRQAQEQGKTYDDAIDTAHYNFAIGVASSTNIAFDLVRRVSLDQLSRGQYTADIQKGYDALRGRQFAELGCHSNGAMICLAALQNGDVLAGKVVLFGPQLTAESIRMWSQMVESGQVSSVEFVVNANDPVPALSLYASTRFRLDEDARRIAGKPLFRSATALGEAVTELGPRVKVSTYACAEAELSNLTGCHDMEAYRKNRACERLQALPRALVPGTRLPGGQLLAEPPPPC